MQGNHKVTCGNYNVTRGNDKASLGNVDAKMGDQNQVSNELDESLFYSIQDSPICIFPRPIYGIYF